MIITPGRNVLDVREHVSGIHSDKSSLRCCSWAPTFPPSSPGCCGNSTHAVAFAHVWASIRATAQMRICVADCAVFYSPDDGEAALCRQPDLILWPPPKPQHVGNKPFSSNPQTVQQSMGNYVCDRWASLSISPTRCLSRCPLCILSPSPLFFSFFHSHAFCFAHPSPSVPPPALPAPEMRQQQLEAVNRSLLLPQNMCGCRSGAAGK